MLFPTVQFAIFFPVVLALSWALMSRPRAWKPFILLASYVFYAAASWRFCLLLGGITLGNQAAAKLAAFQVRHDHPDGVVVFIGANEGFPMPGPSGREVACCSAEWAAIYANRVRQIANTYRQNGIAHVYWITLPTPREPARQTIARVVNAAIPVAVAPWADRVRVIDSVSLFPPGGAYRDSMKVGGTPTIVRRSDGIHLNEAGSSLLAGYVLNAIGKDFTY